MPYKLTLHPKPGYLHAVVTGENTRENVAGYLADLRRECQARGCRRVLVEERLQGARLGTSDVFAIVMDEASRAAGMFEAIAYVDVNAGGDMMRVAENIALGRGIPVRLFGSLTDAENWLENPWGR
ncbi:MAG TPA: hypothetical protein VFT23_12040 [Burkholderiales bacterium]|nr:hypothetical protein [Burkholderiales bacterium]